MNFAKEEGTVKVLLEPDDRGAEVATVAPAQRPGARPSTRSR